MDENADASQVIFEPLSESWRRPPGWPHTTWMKTIQGDLSCLDLELHEARELAQNRPLWRLMSLYSAGLCRFARHRGPCLSVCYLAETIYDEVK